MAQCLKPFKTFEEQIAILESRGLRIENESFAIEILSHVNYYRFSGYAFLRQNKATLNQDFFPGTTFESIYALYEFDQRFRNVTLKYLETVEVLVRTRVAYFFSQQHQNANNDCHYLPQHFTDLARHADIIDRLNEQIARNKEVPFVKKHIECYDGKMPLWAAVEILSFSSVSQLYSIMLSDDKQLISKSLGHTSFYFQNWLHVLSVLRNRCAHYGRLYGVTIAPPIQLPLAMKQKYPAVRNNTLFAAICIICKLLPVKYHVEELIDCLSELLEEYDTRIRIDELSFPVNWKTVLREMKQ
mgnify:CR=1 FL=1